MLRPATDADVDDVLAWRNQVVNREVSTHSDVITPQEHERWWQRTRQDTTRRVLVYEHDGRSCGVVNFHDVDLAGEVPCAGWGFFLDADGLADSGRTLAVWIAVMREAIAYAFDDLGVQRLQAEVLEHNTVVRQMNRRFRFVEGPVDRRTVDGRDLAVIPIHLDRADRRPHRDPHHGAAVDRSLEPR